MRDLVLVVHAVDAEAPAEARRHGFEHALGPPVAQRSIGQHRSERRDPRPAAPAEADQRGMDGGVGDETFDHGRVDGLRELVEGNDRARIEEGAGGLGDGDLRTAHDVLRVQVP